MNLVKLRKFTYEEVTRCNRCGFCLPSCPIYLVKGVESATPRGRNAITRAVIEGRLQWSGEVEKSIFSCLGCGACTANCFPAIKTRDIVFRDRECLVSEGIYPKIADRLAQYILEEGNISNENNEERAEWQELIKGIPEHYFEKEKADVIYFVGCVASFFPLAQKIPASMAMVMEKAGVDFTVLGGQEWCCGYPLIGAGMPDKMDALIKHNVEVVERIGATKVVFTCPSCYHTWKHFYPSGAEYLSASEFLVDLLREGNLELKPLDVKVTYHDPCDLGRNTGVYEPPREVLNSIPGVELVEMEKNRQLTTCCGGGGNLEMVEPELSGKVADLKIAEIQATGADVVVSSCQQCLRTIAGRARRRKIPLIVKDITELLAEAMV
ncbi:MAG: (Fe-S)-binding protein [Deltaproteobacteria bacterium]|nr:(Fe-S)-binding protein [Deltaproteobacteria bacterium]